MPSSASLVMRALLCLAFAMLHGIVSAASMHVAPVRVALTPARAIASLTLGNGEPNEIAVQAEVMAWTQKDGKDVYEPTRDVLVNPAIFRVAGNGQQIVRIGLQVPAGDTERAYRIFLQQLPREQNNSDGTPGVKVQTLLRIGVPIFVQPTAARQQIEWQLVPAGSGGGPVASVVSTGAKPPANVLKVVNNGNEHVQLTQVGIRREGGNDEGFKKTLSLYILPGQTADIDLGVPQLAADAAYRIEAMSDLPSPLPAAVVRTPRANAASR